MRASTGVRGDVALVAKGVDGARAKALASRLSVPLCDTPPAEAAFVLRLSDDGLSIQANAPSAPAPLRVDFTSGRAAWRRGQGEMIVKAVNCKGRSTLHVLDATAGLGRDAFALASHGFRVTLLERDPIIHALLEDGLARAREAEATAEVAARMTLFHADLLSWSPAEDDRPQVVCLDPMFPARRKSARVKKEMALLQGLLSEPDDEAELLARALELTTVKVIVKRPLKATPLAGRQPAGRIMGRSTRFDIYPA